MTAGEPQPLPVLGLMLGDATGIGPEQCARILANRRVADAARLVVVGDARVLEQGMHDARVSFASRSYASVAAIDWNAPEVPIVDMHDFDPQSVRRGMLSPDSGRAAGETLAHAKTRHLQAAATWDRMAERGEAYLRSKAKKLEATA